MQAVFRCLPDGSPLIGPLGVPSRNTMQNRSGAGQRFRRMCRIGCTEGWGVRLWPFGFDVVVEAAVQRQESADYGKSYDVETVEKTHQDEETGDSYDLTL